MFGNLGVGNLDIQEEDQMLLVACNLRSNDEVILCVKSVGL
jgi:hypothetical protein